MPDHLSAFHAPMTIKNFTIVPRGAVTKLYRFGGKRGVGVEVGSS